MVTSPLGQPFGTHMSLQFTRTQHCQRLTNLITSLLDCTAHEPIAGLTLTSANYNEAVSILQRRFGNKQQIISRHMDTLINASPVASPNDLKGLRHLHDQIESHVRGLKSLGVTSELIVWQSPVVSITE